MREKQKMKQQRSKRPGLVFAVLLILFGLILFIMVISFLLQGDFLMQIVFTNLAILLAIDTIAKLVRTD